MAWSAYWEGEWEAGCRTGDLQRRDGVSEIRFRAATSSKPKRMMQNKKGSEIQSAGIV
jgi:hypothetical protein